MPYAKIFFSTAVMLCLCVAPVQAVSGTAQRFAVGQKTHGLSAWYGQKAHGNRTASGARFDTTAYTAAHRTLPFGTLVKVTNPKNKKSVVVKVTDRGPTAKKLIIDISRQAATDIGIRKQGVAPVTVEIVQLPAGYSARRGKK